MNKILCVILFTLFISGISKSQGFNWITPNKAYLKMSVTDDGIFRITKTDFTAAGINTSAIDPRTIKVLNKGLQIPIYFQGESDGTFDASDYFDFYGKRNYGGPTNTYDENNTLLYTTNEYFDLYSDTNVYWVDWGGSNGQRMVNSPYTAPSVFPAPYYNDLVHLEKDKVYWVGELDPSNKNFTNERYRGETWYWNYISTGQVVSDTFSTPLLYSPPQNCTVHLGAYPQNTSSTPNEHSIQLKVNGNLISTITINHYKRIDTTFTFSSSLLSSGGVNTVSATYIANGGFDGLMFIDYFEVSYPKLFKFRNNQSLITLSGTDTTSKQFKVSSYASGNPVSIYDVNNGIRISSFTNSSDTLIFSGKGNSKFEVINKNITKKPTTIIQRQVPDYVSNTNGTDYLLVYNSLFESQATQLKNYRQTKDNFRVTKAEIQDIYDIFNYGILNPVALRNFTRYVYYNWQAPRVKYLCLFGRGSLDPKKNSSSTLFEKNLIPVIGNPSSDNYFANMNGGGFSYYPQISIGRLMAYTPAEAQSMIDNIFTYEAQKPASWDKNFTFIVGGVDLLEQNLLKTYNDAVLLYPPTIPTAGNDILIARNDTNGSVTYNFPDSIKNQINRGTLMVNFMGHAGSQDWELGMTDPNVLGNYNGKFPFILSMTCYTGKVGEPNFRAFGERFMTMTNKGAIGFVATAGYGFVYAGGQLNKAFYKAITVDTLRRIGDIFASAIRVISSDSSSGPNFKHTINCYLLQGDPAVKLLLPKIPEYSISNSDYKLSSNNPLVSQNVTFTAYPKNLGLYSDSCNIRLQIQRNSINYLTRDTTIRNFKYADSIKFSFKFDKPDLYNFSLILDNFNLNPNENRSDNILSFSVRTKNVAFAPLKPVNNGIITSDSVTLVGLNPNFAKAGNSIVLLAELDTTKNFNSPFRKLFLNKNIVGVTTKFKAPLIPADTSVLYYWRTNSVINNDSSGWSEAQIFRYNFPGADILFTDSTANIYKNKSTQYSESDFNNTTYSTNGVTLSPYPGILKVRSYGSNGPEASYFDVVDKSIHIDGGTNTGISMLKVRKLDGKIIKLTSVKMLSPSSSDSVLAFLNTFDSTQYLLALNSSYVSGTFILNSNVIAKFNQFGSTHIQQFRIGWFDTWAFIGYLNAPPSEVFEDIHLLGSAWVESIVSVSKQFLRNTGTVSYIAGPSNRWNNFSWQNTLPNASSLKFDVYGIDRNENQTLLLPNVTTNNNTDLSSINAYQYPKLNLVGKLAVDTLNGLQSPVLNSMRVNYTLPAEIVQDLNTVSKSDSVVKTGQEVKLKFKYYNSGSIKAPGTIVNLYKSSVSPGNIIKSDTINSDLNIDSLISYNDKFTFPYIRVYNNVAQIVVEVLPKGQNNDTYTFNNYNYLNFTLNQSAVPANVEIFSDGHLIRSGDYVSLKPELKINVNTIEKDIRINDTTQVSLMLNNSHVPFYVEGKINTMLKLVDNNNTDGGTQSKKTMIYLPELKAGENKLKIVYRNELDGFDSTEYDVLVSDELLVKDFYNYPNPMRGETSFVFNLAGAEKPQSCRIKIYTVTGRLVKQISFIPVIGYNQVPWDGKDDDGDFISNGTYLYKFIAEDETKKETAVQKLVILK